MEPCVKSMSLEILSGSTATLLLSTPTSLNVAGTAGTAGFREIVLIFKLADRMRSMRTNGASKNRDWRGQNGVIYKFCRI